MKRLRALISVLLFFGGIALLGYGVFIQSAEVLPQNEDTPSEKISGPALVQEASVGGLERDFLGDLRFTYTGEQPKDCAT